MIEDIIKNIQKIKNNINVIGECFIIKGKQLESIENFSNEIIDDNNIDNNIFTNEGEFIKIFGKKMQKDGEELQLNVKTNILVENYFQESEMYISELKLNFSKNENTLISKKSISNEINKLSLLEDNIFWGIKKLHFDTEDVLLITNLIFINNEFKTKYTEKLLQRSNQILNDSENLLNKSKNILQKPIDFTSDMVYNNIEGGNTKEVII